MYVYIYAKERLWAYNEIFHKEPWFYIYLKCCIIKSSFRHAALHRILNVTMFYMAKGTCRKKFAHSICVMVAVKFVFLTIKSR